MSHGEDDICRASLAVHKHMLPALTFKIAQEGLATFVSRSRCTSLCRSISLHPCHSSSRDPTRKTIDNVMWCNKGGAHLQAVST
jgi:hypothetical protein